MCASEGGPIRSSAASTRGPIAEGLPSLPHRHEFLFFKAGHAAVRRTLHDAERAVIVYKNGYLG
ncbi:MAG: hypothetical protein WDM77_09795 [Steroidobacteraceae bacterium]